MKQTIEIDVPDGYKAVYDENTQRVEIVKVELPKTWEEFCKNNPVEFKETYIYNGRVNNVRTDGERTEKDKDLLPNRETAEAFLALMQLIQLRDCYRQGWKPDWSCDGQQKYSVLTYSGEVSTDAGIVTQGVLSFQSEEIRNEFFKNFRELIEKAKELI